MFHLDTVLRFAILTLQTGRAWNPLFLLLAGIGMANGERADSVLYERSFQFKKIFDHED